ncbi:MAG: ACT domain-containing protein [Microthrixaceae bacterium]
MATYVLRVWIPDRPGALGAVATRIGAVRADVIGIDIIERGAGRAVDDLVIELPDGQLVDLLLAEIAQVEGVDVEDIRELDGPPSDPAIKALVAARDIRDAGNSSAAMTALVRGAQDLIGADWAALIDLRSSEVIASVGENVPNDKWLCAFIAGATADGAASEHEELALTSLSDSELQLLVSRGRLPIRTRERSVLHALAALI